jgi:hypothetical protein
VRVRPVVLADVGAQADVGVQAVAQAVEVVAEIVAVRAVMFRPRPTMRKRTLKSPA